MDRRRCSAWKGVIVVGCFAYLKGLETASLVSSTISLTKLFASLARSAFFFLLLRIYTILKKNSLVTLECSSTAPAHFNVTSRYCTLYIYDMIYLYIYRRSGHTPPITCRAVTQKLETQNQKEDQISIRTTPDNAESAVFSDPRRFFP